MKAVVGIIMVVVLTTGALKLFGGESDIWYDAEYDMWFSGKFMGTDDD